MATPAFSGPRTLRPRQGRVSRRRGRLGVTLLRPSCITRISQGIWAPPFLGPLLIRAVSCLGSHYRNSPGPRFPRSEPPPGRPPAPPPEPCSPPPPTLTAPLPTSPATAPPGRAAQAAGPALGPALRPGCPPHRSAGAAPSPGPRARRLLGRRLRQAWEGSGRWRPDEETRQEPT